MRTTDTTTRIDPAGWHPGEPAAVAAAYRRLAVVLLGLDADSLIREMRVQRSSCTKPDRRTVSTRR
jgi:hypothetical protein